MTKYFHWRRLKHAQTDSIYRRSSLDRHTIGLGMVFVLGTLGFLTTPMIPSEAMPLYSRSVKVQR